MTATHRPYMTPCVSSSLILIQFGMKKFSSRGVYIYIRFKNWRTISRHNGRYLWAHQWLHVRKAGCYSSPLMAGADRGIIL